MAAERRAPTPAQARSEWLDADGGPDGLVIEAIDLDEENDIVQVGATFGNLRVALAFPRDDLRGPRALLVDETFSSIVGAVDDRVSCQPTDRDEPSDAAGRDTDDDQMTETQSTTKYSAGIDAPDPLDGHRLDDTRGRL